MKFTKLEIPGLVLFEPRVFSDPRGHFLETYHGRRYAEAGVTRPFVQDNHSHSNVRGVLRGLHSQVKQPPGKVIYVVRGEIWDVAVDVRRGSPTFGKFFGCALSSENHHQLYVPEGCLHGFVVVSEIADVIYKCTNFYDPKDEVGVIWNDPAFNLPWPVTTPLLSAKDEKLQRFADLPEDRIPVFGG
jgi:dTDP-4-dehydrorhamnose 3,5-epimerase